MKSVEVQWMEDEEERVVLSDEERARPKQVRC